MKLINFKEYKHNLNIIKYNNKYKEEYIKIHTVGERYWTAERILNALNKFNVFLAIENNHVVGYIDVSSNYDTNEPYDLYVLENHRNNGYGKALLSEAIKANYPKKIDLNVDFNNTTAKHIYKELGFEMDETKDSLTVHIKL